MGFPTSGHLIISQGFMCDFFMSSSMLCILKSSRAAIHLAANDTFPVVAPARTLGFVESRLRCSREGGGSSCPRLYAQESHASRCRGSFLCHPHVSRDPCLGKYDQPQDLLLHADEAHQERGAHEIEDPHDQPDYHADHAPDQVHHDDHWGEEDAQDHGAWEEHGLADLLGFGLECLAPGGPLGLPRLSSGLTSRHLLLLFACLRADGRGELLSLHARVVGLGGVDLLLLVGEIGLDRGHRLDCGLGLVVHSLGLVKSALDLLKLGVGLGGEVLQVGE